VLFLFQPPATAAKSVTVQLHGLDPDWSYRLTSGVSGQEQTATGASWMTTGLVQDMPPGTSDIILIDLA